MIASAAPGSGPMIAFGQVWDLGHGVYLLLRPDGRGIWLALVLDGFWTQERGVIRTRQLVGGYILSSGRRLS